MRTPLAMDFSRTHIFVVDDDLAVRSALKFALELEGLPIQTCAGGEELFRHPDLAHAACVVVDRKMPGMDGFAVTQELLARGIAAPIILIAAEVNDRVRGRAARAGIAQVLEKPLQGTVLSDAIRLAMQGGA